MVRYDLINGYRMYTQEIHSLVVNKAPAERECYIIDRFANCQKIERDGQYQ